MQELKSRKTCWVNIRVTPEDRDMIEKLAKENGVSMSVLCLKAIERTYPIAIANGRISAINRVLKEYEELQG